MSGHARTSAIPFSTSPGDAACWFRWPPEGLPKLAMGCPNPPHVSGVEEKWGPFEKNVASGDMCMPTIIIKYHTRQKTRCSCFTSEPSCE